MATIFNFVGDHLVQRAVDDEWNRMRRFQQAWEAYYGHFPDPLKFKKDEPNDNVKYNLCGLVVDKGVSFLFGHDIEFDLGEGMETEQGYLDAVWKANDKLTLLQEAAMNGGICGHTFLKLTLEDAPLVGEVTVKTEDEPEPLVEGDVPQPPTYSETTQEQTLAPVTPRLVVWDPSNVKVVWEPDDYMTVVRYVYEWQGIDPDTNKPVFYRQTIERDDNGASWTITDEERRGDMDNWIPVGEPEVWPYPWAPVIDCQNLKVANEYWGLSDIEPDVIALNQSINLVMSNINRILKYHAHPKTYIVGFAGNADDIDMSVDAVTMFPTVEADMRNLEMGTDLASSLAFYERLMEAFFVRTKVPQVAVGKMDNVGPSSGTALGILYEPLVEQTEKKRGLYGDMLEELNRRLLELGGFQGEATNQWPELLPKDELQEAQTAAVYKTLGVSDDTLMQRLGFDPDEERKKRQAQQQEELSHQEAQMRTLDAGFQGGGE